MDVGSEESADSKGIPCRCVVLTDVGKRRQENQDSYGYVHTQNGSLFLVADGMGGAQGGATASALAIEVIAKRAINSAGLLSAESLVTAVRLANQAIHEHAKSSDKLSGMGTTLVALAIFSDKAIVAHVGDSRIYLLKNDALTLLTRDHTLVQELMDAGTISAEQAENHPISHMLTRSIGPTPNVDVELQVYPLPLTEGDRFLLCCDGLTNHVEDLEIQRILEAKDDLRDAAEMFIELANQRGGSDNITVQLVEVCSYDESARSELSDGKVEFVKSSEIKFDEAIIPEMPKLDSPEVETEEAEPTHARANGEDHSSSAVDSILFGENPTTDEVRDHERRAEKKMRAEEAVGASVGADNRDAQPTVEGEVESPGSADVDVDEEEDEFAFLDEDQVASEGDEKSFRQVQMIGVAVIAVAVVAVILVVVGQTNQRVRLGDVGTRPQVASIGVPDEAEPQPEEVAPPAEAVNQPDLESGTTPAQPAEIVSPPEPTIVKPEEEEVSAQAQGVEGGVDRGGESEAWPSSEIIPTDTIEEDVKSAAKPENPEAAAAIGRLENKKSIIRQKVDVRSQIDDANYRLALLTLPSQLDVVKRKEKLTAELAEAEAELAKGSGAASGRDGDVWKMRKTSIEAGKYLEVAKEVSPEVPELGGLIQMYEAAKMLADNAASAAESSPGDEELASRTETLNKELATHRQKLVSKLTDAVEDKIAAAHREANDPFTGYLDEGSIKSRIDQIKRKLEVIDSLSWGLSMERLEQQVKIEAQKKELEKKLWGLGLKVSDEEEEKILKSLTENGGNQESSPSSSSAEPADAN